MAGREVRVRRGHPHRRCRSGCRRGSDPPESKEEIAIRAGERFYAASCYKVPLELYLYEEALDGQVDLEEKLVYTEDYYQGGAGILKDEEPGSSYDLRYLASLAIIDSDNIAAHMLIDRPGRAPIEQYQRDLGAEGVDLRRNLASPRDVALVLERLLILTGQHPDHFGEILAWMEVSYPRNRIPLGLPDSVRVANKTGTWQGVFNDAALTDHHWAADRLGPGRLGHAYAWRSLLAAGVPLAGGSDAPIEPVNPFFGLHAAVTRQDRDGHPPGAGCRRRS